MSLSIGCHYLVGCPQAERWRARVAVAAEAQRHRWLPAPWRLLRALAQGAQRLQGPVPHESTRHLLLELLSPPPRFTLDSGSSGSGGGFVATWPECELPSADRRLLDRILEELSLLDSDQTWLQARCLDAPPERYHALPLARPASSAAHLSLPRLALMSRREWQRWRADLEQSLARRALASIPRDRWQALTLSSEALQRGGWRNPPGARVADYLVGEFDPRQATAMPQVVAPAFAATRQPALRAPAATIRHCATAEATGAASLAGRAVTDAAHAMARGGPSIATHRGRDPSLPHPASLAIYGIERGEKPSLVSALQVSDTLRKALLAWSRDRDGLAHPIFSGRDRWGRPSRGRHSHAHFFALDHRGDGWIDRLLVWSPAGFDPRAQAALRRGRRLWAAGGLELALRLLALEQLPPAEPPAPLATELRSLVGPATTWISRTPFVLSRHPRRRRNGEPKRDPRGRWIDGPEWQLQRALRQHGAPRPLAIEPLPACRCDGREQPWERFQTRRPEGGGRRFGGAYGFRLRFAEPFPGPLLLGYGAHQGLGLFLPLQS
jgi:CRISPR-associated protein Csb2